MKRLCRSRIHAALVPHVRALDPEDHIFGNIGRMVRNALQICANLHRGDNLSHIRCDGVKPKQQVDPVLVDLLLKNVDLFVISVLSVFCVVLLSYCSC